MSFVNKITSTFNSMTSGIIGSTININGKSVTVGDKLADGGYGIIYKATDSNGKVYALKVLQAPDDEHYQDILREYEIQKRCSDHPNIISVYGMTSHQQTHQATILMEFCPDDLIKHMNAVFKQGFDDRTIVEIFTQICEAVNYMHNLDPPVIHRDLKPENVLRNNGKWKLCDFGSATTRVYTLKTTQERNEASDDLEKNTTALYRAPEMCDLFRRQPINTKADVWALGCILFKLCTFKDAFCDGSNLQILNVKYQWPQNKNINQKFKDIVKYIFNVNPTNRPSARDVLGELYRQFPEWVDQKWQQADNSSNPKASEPFNPFGNSPSQSQPFDPFGNNSTQQVHAPPRKQEEPFNPFGNSQPQPAQNARKPQNSFPQRTPQPQFNPFGNSNDSQPTFNPFENANSSNNKQTFDPFGNKSDSQPTFNPFENANSSNNLIDNDDGGTFDPFAGLNSSQDQNSQQLQSGSQDLFDNQPPSGDGASAPFNPFADQPSPSNTVFNPFENDSPAAPQPAHKPPPLGRGDPFSSNSKPSDFDSSDGVSLLGGPSKPSSKNNGPIDFTSFGQPRALSQPRQKGQDGSLIGSGFSDLTKPSPTASGSIDPQRARKDPDGLYRDILALKGEFELSNALFSVNSALNPDEAMSFFLGLLHVSGTSGARVANALPIQASISANQPTNPSTALSNVIASRKSFMAAFPMYEGNFALTNFLRAHRANPVPIGQPPICVEAVKMLLEHIDYTINLMRAAPSETAAEEAYESYQVTAFLLARLKVAKVKEGYTVATAIPRFRNQHGQLKRAFANVGNLQIKFPSDPFDFNDENFLKRIRPPQSKV